MPLELALSLTLIGSNYPCLEHISTVPNAFEALKFCIGIDVVNYLNVNGKLIHCGIIVSFVVSVSD